MNHLKHISIVLTTLIFTSCRIENKEKQNSTADLSETTITNELPIGVDLLQNNNLPENIIYKYDEKGGLNIQEGNLLDSINYRSNLYEKLKIDKKKVFIKLPQIEKNIVYNKAQKRGMIYYLDSCYYAKTLVNDDNIQLKLFKDGGSYNRYVGSENNSVTNYLILASYNKLNELVDYKVIYYAETFYYANKSMYFFLGKKMDLYVNEYETDEEGISLISKRIYKINKQGKFDLKKEFIKEKKQKEKRMMKSIIQNFILL